MLKNVRNLFAKLWNDDCGAIIATEYLALGSIVVLGGVGGLVAMREGAVNEMKEYGKSVSSIRQQYSVPGFQSKNAGTSGSAAIDDSNFAR